MLKELFEDEKDLDQSGSPACIRRRLRVKRKGEEIRLKLAKDPLKKVLEQTATQRTGVGERTGAGENREAEEAASTVTGVTAAAEEEEEEREKAREKKNQHRKMLAKLLGAASEFKDADKEEGVAAKNEEERRKARACLSQLTLQQLNELCQLLICDDEVARFGYAAALPLAAPLASLTLQQLKEYLLSLSRKEVVRQRLLEAKLALKNTEKNAKKTVEESDPHDDKCCCDADEGKADENNEENEEDHENEEEGEKLEYFREGLPISSTFVKQSVLPALTSDIISCVVKLMSNEELIRVSQRLFNKLPPKESHLGARGYMGARIQPNSPTDSPEDIVMQCLLGFSHAVGDVVLGSNPATENVDKIRAVERALRDVTTTFGLQQVLPYCVLAHIDTQARIEEAELYFQSIAGNDATNRIFDISVAKLLAFARSRALLPFTFYFETGQGSEATNGQANGLDVVTLESRKYGFARALKVEMEKIREEKGLDKRVWMIVNDVAGFIGPEVFHSKEQLVRVCLEDTVMSKMHGLSSGLDICATLHMDVTVDELGWVIDQVMPANPGYMMALPSRLDPMLSYMTTSFQDHIHVRHKFGYRVDDRMWAFFKRLGVIDARGCPTATFGDGNWVYLQFCRLKGDARPDEEILAEGNAKLQRLAEHGHLFHSRKLPHSTLSLKAQVHNLFVECRQCLHAEFTDAFFSTLAPLAPSFLHSQAANREEYLVHPKLGEQLAAESLAQLLQRPTASSAAQHLLQVVLSDGLNACSLMDEGHLLPYWQELRQLTAQRGDRALWLDERVIVCSQARVRLGYRIGEVLASQRPPGSLLTLVHLIGERPGNGHNTFSAYCTTLPVHLWLLPGFVDHQHTRVVSDISDSSVLPAVGAVETIQITLRRVQELLSP